MAAPARKVAFSPIKHLAGLEEMPEAERALLEQLNAIRLDLARLLAPPVVTELKTGDYLAGEWETVRYAPASGGATLLLPTPRLENRGAVVTVLVERVALGSLTVQCVGGLVNDQATQTVSLVCRLDFVCDGVAGWRSEVVPGAISLASLATQADDTVVANLSGGVASPTATTIAALASRLRGIGLTVSAGKLLPRQRPRAQQIRDYFLSGLATTGNIGALGWNLLGSGTPAYTRGSGGTGSSNRGALATSAAANDRSCLVLGESETRDVVNASSCSIVQFVFNLNGGSTDKRAFVGMIDTFANAPAAATDALGIYFDSSVDATHWLYIARSGGSGSPQVSSMVVDDANGNLATIHQSVAGTFDFYVGNTLLGSLSSGIPTNNMNLGFRVENLNAGAKTMNVGYFGLDAVAAAAFDDDAFLEA